MELTADGIINDLLKAKHDVAEALFKLGILGGEVAKSDV